MGKDQWFKWVALGLVAVGLSLVLFNVIQVNSLERQVIVHAQQLRALGEATDRVAGQMKRLSVGGPATGGSAEDLYADVKVLHPDVPNYLSDADMHWPDKNAVLDGHYRRGWDSGDPKGFNWVIENFAELTQLIDNYVQSSIALQNRWTDPDKWHGDAAWRVEITDDFKEYTIYLKHGIKWHKPSGVDLNGRHKWLAGEHELTAEDFVFSLDMIRHPQVENGATKNYFEDIESYEAIDDYTLRVRWKRKLFSSASITLGLYPLPKFLFAYAEDGTAFPKETIGLRFNQHWYNNKGSVGTGPYRLVKYEPGVKIQLTRNEDFYGEKPAIKDITYPIYTDQKQTVLKLKAKELDFAEMLPSQYREEWLDWQKKPKNTWPKNNPFLNGSVQCQAIDYPAYSFIGWNTDKPLFSDPKVRTAMTLALNRKDIIKNVYVGLGAVAMGPFLPATGYLDPDVDPLDFDLKRAKELLTDAGWKDSDDDGLLDKKLKGKQTAFSFTLLIINRPETTALANIFKEDLLKIGIKMKVETAEWSLLQKRMDEKKFDAFVGGWLLSWETDPYQLWHSSQADVPKGSNRTGFRNKEADELIEKLRETFDPQERKRMLRRVHQLIYASQNYTFLRTVKQPYCWWKHVKNVQFAKARPNADSNPWWVEGTN